MRIRIIFKTKKGEDAYKKSCSEGKKENLLNKAIAKSAFGEDKVLSENPLVVEIRPKINWLALRVNLPQMVRDGLSKLGCIEQKDFIVEVSYVR
jgi:hypothetical protein